MAAAPESSSDWEAGRGLFGICGFGCESSRKCVCTLTPISKKDGGVRPIAMGETIWKAAATAVIDAMAPVLPALLPDIQLGVAVTGGAVIAVHGVQSALDSSMSQVALLADVANAFNALDRRAIAKALADRPETKPLWHMVRTAYGDHRSPLLVCGRRGLDSVLQSESGVRQGDVLASLLFALTLQPVYERAVSVGCGDEPQSVSAYAVLDDVTFVGRWDRVKAAFGSFVEGCEQLSQIIIKPQTARGQRQDRSPDSRPGRRRGGPDRTGGEGAGRDGR